MLVLPAPVGAQISIFLKDESSLIIDECHWMSNKQLVCLFKVRNRFLKSEKNLIGKLELFNDFLTWSKEQEILNVATCHMKSNDIEVLNFNTNSTIKR